MEFYSAILTFFVVFKKLIEIQIDKYAVKATIIVHPQFSGSFFNFSNRHNY